MAAHLPLQRVAARGQLCHLSVPADEGGLEAAAVAVSLVSGAAVVLHLPPLPGLALRARHEIRLSGALLRANLPAARPLVTQVARELTAEGLSVGILKQRLGWVAERRALFGALPPDAADGLPSSLLDRLLGRERIARKVASSTGAADPCSVSHVGDA